MVGLFLQTMGGDARDRKEATDEGAPARIACYHVDSRLSENIAAIGRPSWKKVVLLTGYCLRAVFYRFRHGIRHFYYVPAPGLRTAVYRDWIVMALCRPFFPFVVYHWHAIGLGDWIENEARPWERWISRRLLARPELSIVLGEFNRHDARQLESKEVVIVPNGIPDPCPAFEREVLPVRIERAKARAAVLLGEGSGDTGGRCEPQEFRAMFIGLCIREKGLFDAVEAIALVNHRLAGSPVRVSLSVAGGFWQESDRNAFEQRIQQPDLIRDGLPLVKYLGFVSGADKKRLYSESDCLCFPTYYGAESFGLVVVEAMAWGLHVVTTRWRTVPELLPVDYAGIVSVQSPCELADALLAAASSDYDPRLRARFVERYTDEQFAKGMRHVILGIGDAM
jgi:glycosyltransferase involved in cell wall biosynthesis